MSRLRQVLGLLLCVAACRNWSQLRSVDDRAAADEACQRGDQRACGVLSGVLADEGQYARAWPMALAACDAGVALGCVTLGYFHREGHPPAAADEQLATRYYGFGCEHGADWACGEYGARLASQGKFAEAARWFAHACDGGVLLACSNLAWLWSEGWKERLDLPRARHLALSTCDAGLTAACRRAGFLLLNGLGGPADADAGFGLLERACYERDGRGCLFAGLALMDAGQTEQGTRFLRRGCAFGDGCEHAAQALVDADGGPALYELLDAAQQACTKGSARGCALLARVLLRDGVRYVPLAVANARAACTAGAPDGCALLDELDAGR